jgi:hypothetical protein
MGQITRVKLYPKRVPHGVYVKNSDTFISLFVTLRGIEGILLCVTAGKVPPPETAQLYFRTLARRGYPPVSAASDTFVRYTGRGTGRGTLHFAWYPLLSPDLVPAQGLTGI